MIYNNKKHQIITFEKLEPANMSLKMVAQPETLYFPTYTIIEKHLENVFSGLRKSLDVIRIF